MTTECPEQSHTELVTLFAGVLALLEAPTPSPLRSLRTPDMHRL